MKWTRILSLLFVIVIIVSALSQLIPSAIIVSGYTLVRAPDQSAVRGLRDTAAWGTWWPDREKNGYKIQGVTLNTVYLVLQKDQRTWEGNLGILNHGKDSSMLTYEMLLRSENEYPLERIKNYFAARRLKSGLKEIVHRLDTFLSNSSNIYGMTITVTSVKDSSYMSTAFTDNREPGIKEIYTAIDRLTTYVASVQGKVIGEPMLNIIQLPDNSYQTMIAVPVNRDLPGKENIRLKKMVLGNILEAEVTGGWSTVIKAEQELRKFVDDYRKESPAIPFQTLLTNRLKEPDTLKWKTRVSYPIF